MEKRFHIKNIDTEDAICMQCAHYSIWENEKKYQVEEVRDILYGKLYFINTHKDTRYGTINKYWTHYIPDYSEFFVDEEEYLELDGCPFLRQQGILRLDNVYKEKYDVSYVAYYGVVPSKKYGEVPTVLFFHTQSTKPDVIAEMRETAKTVAENGVNVGNEM